MAANLSLPRKDVSPASDFTPTEAVRRSEGLEVHVRTPGLPNVAEGVMEYFIPGEACILAEKSFRVDAPVYVEIHGFEFVGMVAYCERRPQGFEIHVVISNVDEEGRRRDARYLVNWPARVYDSFRAPVNAVVVDISRDGLGLESALKMEIGDTVAVESQSNLAFGVVRHCREMGNGLYRAGLLVHNVLTKEQEPASAGKRSWMRTLLSGHQAS